MNFRPQSGGRRPDVPHVYVNEAIKAPNIMIVDESWANLGVFPRAKAFEMGDEAWLDLVQMSYDKDKMISTVKMVDYGKYMYNKWKDDKAKKQKQKTKDMKEMKMKYGIGENDLELKINKAIEFLQAWHSVKLTIRLRGRERIYGEKAKEKLMHAAEKLAAYWRLRDTKPKEEASWYGIILFSK
jgi:translation initiation factor IF-3